MLNKILIANRGEIAVRVIRACKEMGIATVAVFSEADRLALHTQLADEAYCIGPAKASESYLNMQNIISVAVNTRAQGVHPGFGFLSENSTFASMCEDCNITFLGPDPKTIDEMGNKANARALMIQSDVPVIPGSDGLVSDPKQALEVAKDLGYPLMVKASAGGGGKGIRIVNSEDELEAAFISAQNEALAAFGDGSIYMERVILKARHIEIQILGDNFGNVVHLGERDCSLQRRNQKVLEEAPSPVLKDEIRIAMGEAAVRAAKTVSYKGAGTIEFLYDEKNEKFYFMEMNTRIQVEHPVTEMVTGIDIVKEQIRIASNLPLSVKQEDVFINGHSIECRINAEDSSMNFAPSPGEIKYLLMSSGCLGVRVDSAVYSGYVIPPYYDSMIAKLITHGKTREEAIAKMRRCLEEFVIDGIKTNIEFQHEIINNEKYLSGNFDTSFIAEEILES